MGQKELVLTPGGNWEEEQPPRCTPMLEMHLMPTEASHTAHLLLDWEYEPNIMTPGQRGAPHQEVSVEEQEEADRLC